MNHRTVDACAAHQIAGKVRIYSEPMPSPQSAEYHAIMQRAQSFAAQDAALCKVRDFEDTRDEPFPYFGYRGADQQCHVTHDKATATVARQRYPQQKQR